MTERSRRSERQYYKSRLQRWASDFVADLRYVLRTFRHTPWPAAFIVAILAVGVGANVTIASVIDRLLLRPPAGVSEPGQLVRLLFRVQGRQGVGAFSSYPLLLDLTREVDAFDGVAAFTSTQLALGSPDGAQVRVSLVSPSFFSVLGVAPALGRVFTPADGFSDAEGDGSPLAVLSYGFWRQQFGADTSVLGRRLRVGRLTYTVVGVAPPHFRGLEAAGPDLWLPITITAPIEKRASILKDRSVSWLSLVARLRLGVSRTAAAEEATAVVRHMGPPSASYSKLDVVATSIIRGRGPDAPREAKIALWLGAVSAVLLLIACANVSNMLLVRAFTRRREIGVRLALGAHRGRLARQMFAEAAALAIVSGSAAFAVAEASGGLVRRLFFSVENDTALIDTRMIVFTTVVALGTAVAVSLAPLGQSISPDLTRALRTGITSGGGRSSRTRGVFLGVQAALCMLLLVIAGLFAQSLRRINMLDLGMDIDHTVIANFSPAAASAQQRDLGAADANLRELIRALPGVTRVALASGSRRAVAVHTKRHDVQHYINETGDVPFELSVGSGYFRTLGTSVRGRDFAASDTRGAPLVAIINEPLARLLFPGEDAIGQCIYLPRGFGAGDDVCWTVVGVLHGYWYPRSILNRDGLLVYVPLAQRGSALSPPSEIVVSTNGPAAPIISQIRAAIAGARPDVQRLSVRWMRDVVEPELRPWRLAAFMFSLFGGVSLAIAAAGLYAVVAFATAQRAPEIAIRIALGARSHNVIAAVAADSIHAVLVGLLTGLAAAFGLRWWVGPLLFQTSPSDPVIMLVSAAMLLAAAALATAIPAMRATRSNVAMLLRID